ncbi:DMT family transporter [Thalassolituus sp. LLYu03]|uniref:DMT family transporter n=1 Tax=Thalassolituus sp. LLYu03 TaxID=3421656 RepID=UPI003D26BC61
MPFTRLALLTCLTMVAFAANSVLNRLALAQTDSDALLFTFVRLLAGAVFLALLVRVRSAKESGQSRTAGNWPSALALLTYAAGFSLAYRELSAATGALLLFGAVQVSMISVGLVRGERPGVWQLAGLGLALAGVVWLLLPGATAPGALSAALMILAGVAWGVYSLRGRGASDPTAATAGNFLRASVLALAVLPWVDWSRSADGLVYALLSGALASGAGYALWYAVLPHMKSATAATVQLSVPVITALAGVLLLGELLSVRLMVASVLTLGGIALYIRAGKARTK